MLLYYAEPDAMARKHGAFATPEALCDVCFDVLPETIGDAAQTDAQAAKLEKRARLLREEPTNEELDALLREAEAASSQEHRVDDATLAARVMSTRNFGFAGQDTIAYGGTNAKLSEPHAALALRHLRCVDATISAYRRVARAYGDALRRRLDRVRVLARRAPRPARGRRRSSSWRRRGSSRLGSSCSAR